MSWIVLLGFAVVLIAIVAVVGLKPKGGRPVANTGLMAAARVVLGILALILLLLAWRAAS